MNTHECKYWDVNPRYYYRRCRYCNRMQYIYSGKWENAITLQQFVSRWTPLDGHEFINRLQIECCQLFEFNCHESWGVAIKIYLDGECYGPFVNLNQADTIMKKKIDSQ